MKIWCKITIKLYIFVPMKLFNYINDLLYRYDCVVVPNFGGFVTNRIGTTISSNTFYPPSKQVSFNVNLKHNDGLLANYIASVENISFEKANEKIYSVVLQLQEDIKVKPVEISSVGSLLLNKDNQIVFTPNNSTNLLTESFGLVEIEASEINRKEVVIPVVSAEKSNNKLSSFVKYAASVAVLLTFGIAIYNQNNDEEIVLQQHKVEQKIQEATFVINEPLPTINLSVKRTNNINIVAGAFEVYKNAEKKVKELKNKGFNSKIIGKNKWGLFQVSLGDFQNELEARKELIKVRKLGYKDAWIFINKNK